MTKRIKSYCLNGIQDMIVDYTNNSICNVFTYVIIYHLHICNIYLNNMFFFNVYFM